MLFGMARGSFVVSGLETELVVLDKCRGALYMPGVGTVLELSAVELYLESFDMMLECIMVETMEYPLRDGSGERRKAFLLIGDTRG